MIHVDSLAIDPLASMILFRNVLAEGTLAASTEAADGAKENALGPQTYDYWTPTAAPATLSVTLSGDVKCDCAAIFAHDLGSKGATVAVQYYDTATTSWVTAQTVTPTDDSPILMIFAEEESDQWRFLVTNAVASIGIGMIGPRLLIPGGTQASYTPLNLALDIELMPSVSIAGQFLGTRINRKGASASIAISPQERSWIETTAKTFIAHYNAGQPFVWASCPDLLKSDVAYCWRAGGTLQASYGAGALFGDISMDVSAYVGA